MRVSTTDLDGYPLGEVDLTRSADGRATVNGQAVIAMRPLGSRVTLVVDRRQLGDRAEGWMRRAAPGDASWGLDSTRTESSASDNYHKVGLL